MTNFSTKSNRLLAKLSKKILLALILILALIIVYLGIGKPFLTDSKTTKLNFENIGELATQSAYATEVNVTDASRDLFGVPIPFTQSKSIYSYDVIIKAGFDFEKIDYAVKEKDQIITVKLPQPKILSSEIDPDSFKVFHESESLFRNITLDEQNEALKKLKTRAEKDAVHNGLLDNAKTNAEAILKAFFASEYDLKKYEITFSYK